MPFGIQKTLVIEFSCFSFGVKIGIIFGVRFERRKVDKEVNLYENWSMQTLF